MQSYSGSSSYNNQSAGPHGQYQNRDNQMGRKDSPAPDRHGYSKHDRQYSYDKDQRYERERDRDRGSTYSKSRDRDRSNYDRKYTSQSYKPRQYPRETGSNQKSSTDRPSMGTYVDKGDKGDKHRDREDGQIGSKSYSGSASESPKHGQDNKLHHRSRSRSRSPTNTGSELKKQQSSSNNQSRFAHVVKGQMQYTKRSPEKSKDHSHYDYKREPASASSQRHGGQTSQTARDQ